MKSILITAFLSVMACPGIYAQTQSDASFGATVYAQQSMANNDTPAYMVEWAAKTNGAAVTNDKADIANHVTTLNIDASAISGTVSSVSVYAHSKAAIAGALMYNGATSAISMPAGTPVSAYASSGQSDVVTVVGTDKTCKAYLLPVALKGGVKVTVRTDDGKFYSQDFTEDIAAGATKTLALTNVAANNLWMATIPGNTYFSFVSTPGAHDAATSGVTSYTSSSKCQDMTIEQLLKAGVRAFDIRPGYYYTTNITADNLYIYHGQVSTNVLYKDAMKTLADFVKDNPSEAISIVMVKENCKPTFDLTGKWTDRSSEMWAVVNAVQEQYKAYMKVLDHSYYTLDDFRGKICYVNRTGTSVPYTTQITNWPDNGTVSDYSCVAGLCNANVQDAYNSNGENKQNAVKEMLQSSSSNTKFKNMHYNYCSSANSPATYANATNPVITTYLNDGNITGPAGYVYADYIGSQNNGGAALLSAIVCQNYRYVYNGMSADGAQQNGANWDLTLGSDFCWTKKGNWADAYGTQNGEMHVTENYAGWGSLEQTDFSLLRNVSLSAGIYKLTAYALYRDGVTGSAKLVAKNGAKMYGSINIAPMTAISSTGNNDLEKAANAFTGDNYLNTVYFVLTDPVEITVGFEGKHTGVKQWFVAGPVTLEKIETFETGADVTSLIANPTIYNESQSSCPNGWTEYARAAGNGNRTTGTGDTKIENWHGTPANAKFDYYQTLVLPAGKYALGASVQYNGSNGNDVGIYAYDVVTRERVTASPTVLGETMSSVTLEFTTSGGEVNIGMINLGTMSGSWFAADDFTLKYEGFEIVERETPEGNYGTICLPYKFNAVGAKVYNAKVNEECNSVMLEEAIETEAGKAYIYQAEDGNKQTFTYKEGAVVLRPAESDCLQGVFKATQAPVSSYVLQTQNNGVQAFYIVAGGKQPTLSPYKAFIAIQEQQPNAAKVIAIGEEPKATAIDALNALATGNARIYDLNGCELKSLQKGVNIVNGVKVLVK